MDPIDDPAQLTRPRLGEFAYQAAWIATVAEAANDVERWSRRHCPVTDLASRADMGRVVGPPQFSGSVKAMTQ
jgi:hypothetical protein